MPDDIRRKIILGELHKSDKPMSAHELARATGINFMTLAGVKEMGDLSMLDQMVEDGEIIRHEEGLVYRYSPKGDNNGD